MLPAVFLVLVFCWYQIAGFSVFRSVLFHPFLYTSPHSSPLFSKVLKKRASAPLLRKKGGTTPFLVLKCNDRVFLGYGIGNTGEIPTEYQPKIPNWYTTLILTYNMHKTSLNFRCAGQKCTLIFLLENTHMSICSSSSMKWYSRWTLGEGVMILTA